MPKAQIDPQKKADIEELKDRIDDTKGSIEKFNNILDPLELQKAKDSLDVAQFWLDKAISKLEIG